MWASPDQLSPHTDEPKHLQTTTSGGSLAHISHTKKGFSQLHSHHSFNTRTPPKVPIPHQWTFPEHDMSLRVLLEKRHQHLRQEQLDPDRSILVKVSFQPLYS